MERRTLRTFVVAVGALTLGYLANFHFFLHVKYDSAYYNT